MRVASVTKQHGGDTGQHGILAALERPGRGMQRSQDRFMRLEEDTVLRSNYGRRRISRQEANSLSQAPLFEPHVCPELHPVDRPAAKRVVELATVPDSPGRSRALVLSLDPTPDLQTTRRWGLPCCPVAHAIRFYLLFISPDSWFGQEDY